MRSIIKASSIALALLLHLAFAYTALLAVDQVNDLATNTNHSPTTRVLYREDSHARPNTNKNTKNKSNNNNKNNNLQNVHTPTLFYKHEDLNESDFRLLFALLFLLVVLPPAVFICIYAPGECMGAIGIGEILIGGILHLVHSQDPTHEEIPWHTSPHLYVVSGILWILIGGWKMYIQSAARELEKEEAEERRRKYTFLRNKWEQEAIREQRTREREKRRKQRVLSRRTPQPFPLYRGNSMRQTREFELAPLTSNNNRNKNNTNLDPNHHQSPSDMGWDEDDSYMTV